MKSYLIYFRKTSLFFLSCLTNLCVQIFAENNLTIGGETLFFNDGSSLIGHLQEAEKAGNIVWHHKDSKNPLSFGYKAVESVLFNRIVAIDKHCLLYTSDAADE